MKKTIIILYLLVEFISSTCLAQQSTSVKLNVDWPKFMAQHDLVWNKLPADYFEGAFIGNGLLGAIVFKDDIKIFTT